MMDHPSAPSARTQVRRIPRNAAYDRQTVHAIVDAAYICHIAFHDDHGAHCIPTACWREGEYLYIHGSNGSRMLKRLMEQDACVTITHVDGLVLARSAFNHSMNYRSVMVYGRFELVAAEHKSAALEAFMEHLAPGRQAQVRAGNDKEYAATSVLRLSLAEAACKIRSGPVEDDEEDMTVPVWAGVLPLAQVRLAPQVDAQCSVAAPDYVLGWSARAG
jgi:nitroimidazol reductase NimA-like FMN-containing flavoprotein (pyridoxamine 5'-phosphate oxidase superfamily)